MPLSLEVNGQQRDSINQSISIMRSGFTKRSGTTEVLQYVSHHTVRTVVTMCIQSRRKRRRRRKHKFHLISMLRHLVNVSKVSTGECIRNGYFILGQWESLENTGGEDQQFLFSIQDVLAEARPTLSQTPF